MQIGLLIVNGTFEHPCIRKDSGECATCCPNYCTPDGYTYREAVILGIPRDNCSCAIPSGLAIRKGE